MKLLIILTLFISSSLAANEIDLSTKGQTYICYEVAATMIYQNKVVTTELKGYLVSIFRGRLRVDDLKSGFDQDWNKSWVRVRSDEVSGIGVNSLLLSLNKKAQKIIFSYKVLGTDTMAVELEGYKNRISQGYCNIRVPN